MTPVRPLIDHAGPITTKRVRWPWRFAVSAVAGLLAWTALQLVYGVVEFNERRAAVQEQADKSRAAAGPNIRAAR